MNVLVVKTGIFGEHSNSNKLAETWAAKVTDSKDATVVTRDLTSDPLPYFDAQVATALNTAEEERDEAQKAIVALSDELIAEIKNADAIVVGVPMYNFGIPAQMKSWFDLLARAGVTFHYTENGPAGLLDDKPVYVAAARGGMHQGQVSDSQTAFLKTMFGFLGFKSVSIAYAEGLAMGDEAKAKSFSEFEERAAELA